MQQRITALCSSRQLGGTGLLLPRRVSAPHLARILLPIHLVDDLLRVRARANVRFRVRIRVRIGVRSWVRVRVRGRVGLALGLGVAPAI